MSDTPKTDNELIDTYDYGYVVPASFARELERERNRLFRILEYVRDSSDGAENAYNYMAQLIDDESE